MSLKNFIKAYKDSNITQLRKYIKHDKVISTHKLMTYVEKSFLTNRDIYNILVLILFSKYNLNKIVADIIDRDNIDLLENILSNDIDFDLDENLILRTLPKGRISMAKAIYEYIHHDSDSDSDSDTDTGLTVLDLLVRYDFVYDETENSIDSFVLALSMGDCRRAKQIIPLINPSFWNNYAIKYVTSVANICILKQLLLHNAVDPGVDDNIPLKIAMKTRQYHIANELLKHPLVRVNRISLDFVVYLIENNCLCVAEKIFNIANNNNIISFFKIPEIVDLLITSHNDVTYLALKMGIIKTTDREIKNNLKNYKINIPYIEKPYELQLDPVQIIKRAIKHNDMDLAKSIKNYPMSIKSFRLLCYLITYKDNNEESGEEIMQDVPFSLTVCDFIWDNILKQYDPNNLLLETLRIDRNVAIHRALQILDNTEFAYESNVILKMVEKYDTILFDTVLEKIDDNPDIDYEYICNKNNKHKKYMWNTIKGICSIDECKRFIEVLIDEDFIPEPLDEDFDDLSEDDQIDELDRVFDKFIS